MTAIADSLEIESTTAVPLRSDGQGGWRIGDTRVSFDVVIQAFQEGQTAEQIAQSYDTLDLADIYAVIAYYLGHRTQVDAYLQARLQDSRRLADEVEVRFPSQGLRERLLARRTAPAVAK